VQGRLREKSLWVDIETTCAHCDEKVHIRLDSDGKWSVKQKDAPILVFEPEVDWATFSQPNIIDDF
jgi:hypothetical protein